MPPPHTSSLNRIESHSHGVRERADWKKERKKERDGVGDRTPRRCRRHPSLSSSGAPSASRSRPPPLPPDRRRSSQGQQASFGRRWACGNFQFLHKTSIFFSSSFLSWESKCVILIGSWAGEHSGVQCRKGVCVDQQWHSRNGSLYHGWHKEMWSCFWAHHRRQSHIFSQTGHGEHSSYIPCFWWSRGLC